MDAQVLTRLAGIETAAEKVLGETAAKKAALAKAMEEKTAAYDAETDARVKKAADEQKAALDQRLKEQLGKLEDETNRTLKIMEDRFSSGEDAQADEIVAAIMK